MNFPIALSRAEPSTDINPHLALRLLRSRIRYGAFGRHHTAYRVWPLYGGLASSNWLAPPMSAIAWADAFDAYRGSPEFRQLNFWMELEDFKRIFWLEYLHRLLGRVIGLIYLFPFLWFFISIPHTGAPHRSLSLSVGTWSRTGWSRLVHGQIRPC